MINKLIPNNESILLIPLVIISIIMLFFRRRNKQEYKLKPIKKHWWNICQYFNYRKKIIEDHEKRINLLEEYIKTINNNQFNNEITKNEHKKIIIKKPIQPIYNNNELNNLINIYNKYINDGSFMNIDKIIDELINLNIVTSQQGGWKIINVLAQKYPDIIRIEESRGHIGARIAIYGRENTDV